MAGIDDVLNAGRAVPTQNTNTTKAKANVNKDLDVESFYKLLAAQLQNQDMFNTMNDTEFMGQMAQFTMLQSINDLKDYMQESTATSYAMSLVGKTVTAASIDKDGNVEKVTGEITGVSFYEGQPVFYIGEKGFYLSQLMVVGTVPEPPATEDKPEDGSGEDKPSEDKPADKV